MRGKFVAGNWKMNTDLASGMALAHALVTGCKADAAISAGLASGKLRTAVCPPFPYLIPVGTVVKGTGVELGAQNCYHEKPGAFTGEVAAPMLKELGCGLVIGGGLGNNLVDRLIYGKVADFFHFHAFGYNWYVFNIADVAVVLGAVAFIYDMLKPSESSNDA